MQTLFGSGDASVPSCTCPACDLPIRVEDVNDERDTAYCRYCRTTYRCSGLGEPVQSFEYLLSNPLGGTNLQQMASGFVATADNEPVEWSVLVVVLVLVLAFGNAFTHGSLQTPRDVTWLVIWAAVLLVGGIQGVRFIRLALGQVEVSRFGDNVIVSEGIRSIGRTRRFRWSEVRSVTEIVWGA